MEKRIDILFHSISKIIISLILLLTLLLIPEYSWAKFRDVNYKKCHIFKDSYDLIIQEVKKRNYNALTSPKDCLKRNQKLIFEACLIDPKQLQYALNIFRDNDNFVYRLIKIHPESLLYASDRLRSDPDFIERSLFLNRDSLKYATDKLRDNYLFIKRMINKDSRNYIFASPRIQKDREIATNAFQDNGNLILYAPKEIRDDKEMVKIAIQSSADAFEFLEKKLRKDPEIKKLSSYQKDSFSKQKLERHLLNNYIIDPKRKNYNRIIDQNFSNHPQNKLIDRKYVSKWHKSYKLKGLYLKEKWRLVSLDNRNYVPDWKSDMKNYSQLVEKVERFFKRRYVDQDTINNLRLNYLWMVQKEPQTIAFNLYLLRNSKDIELSEGYVNVTSLTAIARKNSAGKWRLTVVEVLFNKELRASIAYKNYHKRYFIQDLYSADKNDKNPKIIFRVEDKLDSYFEVFSKMSGDKYHLAYRIKPDGINTDIDYNKVDVFGVTRPRQQQEEYEWQKDMEECQENPRCAKKIR